MPDDTPQTPPSPPSAAAPNPAPRPPVPGIRPITVKPVALRPPAPAQAQPPLAAGGTPATIRLKPVVMRPSAPPPKAQAPTLSATPTMATQPPVPEEAGPATSDTLSAPPTQASASSPPTPDRPAPNAADAPTVRVKPLIMKGSQPPLTPLGTPQPGGAPLPSASKPLKPEQIQAAKAKTSRISLDAALIGDQEERSGPKTIRLKRPSDAPVGKITSHLGTAAAAATLGLPSQSRHTSPLIPPLAKKDTTPVVNRFTQAVETPEPEVKVRRTGEIVTPAPPDASLHGTAMLPPDPAAQDDSSVTRRKTIRVKRPGLSSIPPASGSAPDSAGAETAAGEEPAPTHAITLDDASRPQPVERTHWFFPVLAVATLFVLIALLVVQRAQDRELWKRTVWPPDAPSIRLPGMAPLPGRK